VTDLFPVSRDDVVGEAWSAGNLATLIATSGARYGDRTALWVDGCRVSYRELLKAATGVAHALVDHDCADPPTDRRCAILGGRCMLSFVGILGAVLAGATYVPMNPRHPPDRLAVLLGAAELDSIIVCDGCADLAHSLLDLSPRPLRVLMPHAPTVPGRARTLSRHQFLSRDDLEPQTEPLILRGGEDKGVYLLFTSGSTGAPKGVLVRNRNVMAYLRAVSARYAPQPEDRFTQLFDLTFDLSVHDMFLCWGAGATLYCPPESVRMAPRDFVRRHDLTFWFSVPSVAVMMSRLRMLRPGDFPSLRWSLFCGEALPKRLAEAWIAAAPNSVVENLYGPTEATIAITAYRVPRNPDLRTLLPDVIPLGYPLEGQQAKVIRASGHPAEDGEDGELYVGGSQVTDGYWERPDLTAERFIISADEATEGRWYRTGDRVRRTADHGLLFLGRVDRQIKVAGHRIELDEVEAALRRAAGCDSAAALASPIDSDGLARGILAFVPVNGTTPDVILENCRRILPHYMVPSAIRLITEWPLNVNGKTDYKRLLATEACVP
jgi:D-alanine--poly(phosphoribitol) ligase subunit 1